MVEPTGLLAGGKVPDAPMPSSAAGTAFVLPQPRPGGSGAIASQPKPGGMAGGSRATLLLGMSADSAGKTEAGTEVGAFSTTTGSALVVFAS